MASEETQQWHLRPSNPSNPVVFFGEVILGTYCFHRRWEQVLRPLISCEGCLTGLMIFFKRFRVGLKLDHFDSCCTGACVGNRCDHRRTTSGQGEDGVVCRHLPKDSRKFSTVLYRRDDVRGKPAVKCPPNSGLATNNHVVAIAGRMAPRKGTRTVLSTGL
jgi:hypothetical protein